MPYPTHSRKRLPPLSLLPLAFAILPGCMGVSYDTYYTFPGAKALRKVPAMKPS